MILFVVREEDEDAVCEALNYDGIEFMEIEKHPEFKDVKHFSDIPRPPIPEQRWFVDDIEIELCHYGKQLATTKYDWAHIYQQFYEHVKECNVCKPKETKNEQA